jgi:hypothetical protein
MKRTKRNEALERFCRRLSERASLGATRVALARAPERTWERDLGKVLEAVEMGLWTIAKDAVSDELGRRKSRWVVKMPRVLRTLSWMVSFCIAGKTPGQELRGDLESVVIDLEELLFEAEQLLGEAAAKEVRGAA